MNQQISVPLLGYSTPSAEFLSNDHERLKEQAISHRQHKSAASKWSPLLRAVAEHPRYAPKRPAVPSTPFDTPLPRRIPRKYWINTNNGLNFALYCLVYIGRDDVSDMLQTVKFHADEDIHGWTQKVVRAPIHDFCTGKTLRDVYDYHTSLMDDGNHGLAPSRFVVVVHPQWEAQGVLLVDLDCNSVERGTPGMMRVDVEVLPHHIVLLEATSKHWPELKVAELNASWPRPIPGYTGTSLQTGITETVVGTS